MKAKIKQLLIETENRTGVSFQELYNLDISKIFTSNPNSEQPEITLLKNIFYTTLFLLAISTAFVAPEALNTDFQKLPLIISVYFIFNMIISFFAGLTRALYILLKGELVFLEEILHFFINHKDDLIKKFREKSDKTIIYRDLVVGILLAAILPWFIAQVKQKLFLIGSLFSWLIRFIFYGFIQLIDEVGLFKQELKVDTSSRFLREISEEEKVKLEKTLSFIKTIKLISTIIYFAVMSVYVIFNVVMLILIYR